MHKVLLIKKMARNIVKKLTFMLSSIAAHSFLRDGDGILSAMLTPLTHRHISNSHQHIACPQQQIVCSICCRTFNEQQNIFLLFRFHTLQRHLATFRLTSQISELFRTNFSCLRFFSFQFFLVSLLVIFFPFQLFNLRLLSLP